MPPPKRPFTTSSLTSSLKSTLAGQPLLNNLTNIDKLSSQASSLAQKTPFFGATNQQFQQQNHSEPTLPNRANVGTGFNNNNNNNNNNNPSSSSSSRISNNTNRSEDMNRDVQKDIVGPGKRAPMAPEVDMSHLTEEERAMIQSVMAKAEMADMGLPVDTSSPSSTNLPSTTSQALTQQRDQQQQQQMRKQQQQQQQQSHHLDQQQLQGNMMVGQNQNLGIQTQQSMQTNSSQNDKTAMMSQYQQPMSNMMQQQAPSQTYPMSITEPNNNLYNNQQRVDQQTNFINSGQQLLLEPNSFTNAQQQANNRVVNNLDLFGPTSKLPPLELQTQQPINSNTNMQSIMGPSGDLSYQNNMIGATAPNTTQNISSQMSTDQYQAVNNQSANMRNENPPYAIPGLGLQQQQQQQQQQLQQPGLQSFNNQEMNKPVQVSMLDQIQSQQLTAMAPVQSLSTNNQFDRMGQVIPPQPVQYDAMLMTGANQYGQLVEQGLVDPGTSFRTEMGQFHQENPYSQQHVARQPQVLGPPISPRARPYASASDFEYEPALSDRDLKQSRGKQGLNSSGKPMSRHESMETGRRSARRSRNRDALELQAYDLAQQRAPSTGLIKSRQLPKPGVSGYNNNNSNNSKQQYVDSPLMSSSDYVIEERPNRRSKDTRKHQVKTPERSHRAPKEVSDKKFTRNAPTLTESDLDDDTRTESESDDRKRRQPETTSRVKETIVKQASLVKKNVEKSVTEKEADKSDQALKLLSELKLTEQANQVMEQQQLLIKQSQELIKLQQAQLEQQAEISKTMSDVDRGKKSSVHKVDHGKRKSRHSDEEVEEESRIDSDEDISNDNNQRQNDQDATITKSNDQNEYEIDDKRSLGAKRSSGDKTRDGTSSRATENNDSDIDVVSRKTKHKDAGSAEIESKSERGRDFRSSKNDNVKSRRQSPANTKGRSMSALTRKQNRELAQSPTDTTDSDIDLISQTSSRHQRNRMPAKSTPITRMRREPKGLPPSPLPVAAAIQLHQMQQKYRNQAVPSNFSRVNQLRSRSVTSSPNHMLDRLASGYMTDNQRARPHSPDTMSEYGGQRRRKRLPEPPSNVVPITPSIVRRMVQANRAAAANSDRLASMNMNTTMLPSSLNKMSPYHGINFDHRPSLPINYRPSLEFRSASSLSSSLLLNRPIMSGAQQISTKHLDDPIGYNVDKTGIDSMYNKSDIMRDSDSILRTSQISDVKETPELDKLISNLDEYYGLDGSIGRNLSPSRAPYSSSSTSRIASRYEPKRDCSLSPSRHITRSPLASGARMPDYPLSSSAQTSYPSTSYPAGPSYGSLAGHSSEQSAYPSHLTFAQRYDRQNSLDGKLNTLSSIGSHVPPVPYATHQYNSSHLTHGNDYFDRLSSARNEPHIASTNPTWPPVQSGQYRSEQPNNYRTQAYPPTGVTPNIGAPYQTTYDPYPTNINQTMPSYQQATNYGQSSYLDGRHQTNYQPGYNQQTRVTASDTFTTNNQNLHPSRVVDRYANNLTITKDDIINNCPKYNSIGYRFRTENQNKYVTETRTPIECLQSRYPYPYKRILLSKNPKDRLGNGIGVKIVGGHSLPNIYDKVNKCILTSGAFVTEVFQSSRVYFMDEMHEGDQIIEWNGVNLCNRSDGEVQQILFSQFSDDEVEIIYLNRHKFKDAYGTDLHIDPHSVQDYPYEMANGSFELFSGMNRPTGYNIHGQHTNDPFKRSIRRKLSLSSISHMWSK